MTIEELKEKIEAIDVPEEAKLTIYVNPKNGMIAKDMKDQIIFNSKKQR